MYGYVVQLYGRDGYISDRTWTLSSEGEKVPSGQIFCTKWKLDDIENRPVETIIINVSLRWRYV